MSNEKWCSKTENLLSHVFKKYNRITCISSQAKYTNALAECSREHIQMQNHAHMQDFCVTNHSLRHRTDSHSDFRVLWMNAESRKTIRGCNGVPRGGRICPGYPENALQFVLEHPRSGASITDERPRRRVVLRLVVALVTAVFYRARLRDQYPGTNGHVGVWRRGPCLGPPRPRTGVSFISRGRSVGRTRI